jgi:hypothetical protein
MVFFLIITIINLKPYNLYPLSSLIIPGTGELLLKEKKGEYFIYADLFSLFFYQTYNFLSKKENELAKIFASKYAHANYFQKENYFQLLEIYPSSEEYNEDILREARRSYPDDPEKQKEYLQKHGYFGKDSWQWENDDLRLTYIEKRRNAKNKKLVSSFFLSASLLLRMGSFFNSLFLIKEKKISFDFYPQGFKISYNF